MGMHAMVLLAGSGDVPCAVAALAGRLRVSEDHLSKVMQRLARAGLVRSARGRCGGFLLARPGDCITFLEVLEAIDGPAAARTCLLPQPVCDGTSCLLGSLLARVNEQVLQSLGGTTLADVQGAAWCRCDRTSDEAKG